MGGGLHLCVGAYGYPYPVVKMTNRPCASTLTLTPTPIQAQASLIQAQASPPSTQAAKAGGPAAAAPRGSR